MSHLIYPKASVKLLNYDWDSRPTITPTQVIEHTAVTDAKSLWMLFEARRKNPDPSKRTFSHAYINELGVFEQYAPFNKKSAAQWAGNLHGISVETWDGYHKVQTPQGLSLPPLNAAQLKTFIEFCIWARDVLYIPARLCPGPQLAGFGYHCLFREWNESNHSCPDPAKIFQFKNMILPSLQVQPPIPEPTPIVWEIKMLANVTAAFAAIPTTEPGKVRQVDRDGLIFWYRWAYTEVYGKDRPEHEVIAQLVGYFETLPPGS